MFPAVTVVAVRPEGKKSSILDCLFKVQRRYSVLSPYLISLIHGLLNFPIK